MKCAIHVPGVKFDHAPGIEIFHRLTTIGKPSDSPTGSVIMQIKLSRSQMSVCRTIDPLVSQPLFYSTSSGIWKIVFLDCNKLEN